jgi:single-strand DNA-binding protein
MKALNRVQLIGNIGKEPEISYLPNGTAVAKLSIATTDSYKNKQEEWQETTEWHKVIVFGTLAQNVEKYLKKGSKVYIEGKLKTRSWEKDGVKHYATDIMGNEMLFLDGKSDKKVEKKQEDDPNDMPF